MDHVFRNTYVVDHCDRLLGVVTIHQILSIIVPPSVGEQARAGQLDGREQLLDALRRNLTAISETPVGHLMTSSTRSTDRSATTAGSARNAPWMFSKRCGPGRLLWGVVWRMRAMARAEGL